MPCCSCYTKASRVFFCSRKGSSISCALDIVYVLCRKLEAVTFRAEGVARCLGTTNCESSVHRYELLSSVRSGSVLTMDGSNSPLFPVLLWTARLLIRADCFPFLEALTICILRERAFLVGWLSSWKVFSSYPRSFRHIHETRCCGCANLWRTLLFQISKLFLCDCIICAYHAQLISYSATLVYFDRNAMRIVFPSNIPIMVRMLGRSTYPRELLSTYWSAWYLKLFFLAAGVSLRILAAWFFYGCESSYSVGFAGV